MVEVTCKNCRRTWDYQGEKTAPSMVTCPDCYYKVRLPNSVTEQ